MKSGDYFILTSANVSNRLSKYPKMSLKKKLTVLLWFLSRSVTVYALSIDGIFDAGWNSWFRDSTQWDLEVSRIKALGMNTLILQYGISFPDKKFYNTTLSWAESLTDNAYFTRTIFSAERAGMDVYLGLYAENDGWWTTPDDTYLIRQKMRCIQVIEDLEKWFTSPVVKGYYIPHEIARYYWQESSDLKRLRENFIIPVCQHIHATTNKNVLISPFYNPDLETPEQMQTFFKEMLFGSGVDIVALQDGVGSDVRRDSIGGPYLRAFAQAASDTKIEYWINIELFSDSSSGPASLERIIRQAKAASAIPSCTKLISYDYSSLTRDHYAHTLWPLYDSLLTWNTSVTTSLTQKQRIEKRQVFSFDQGMLHISKLHGEIPNIRILNICGQTIFQSTQLRQGCSVDLSSLSSGIYFVYLKTDRCFSSGSFFKK